MVTRNKEDIHANFDFCGMYTVFKKGKRQCIYKLSR